MKRREFIGIATVGAAGTVLPAKASGEDRLIAILSRPRLRRMVESDAVVRELGRRYCDLTPAENAVAVLVQRIIQDLDMPSDASESAMSLALSVDDKVQRDFHEGRTLLLDGWVLSETEARQCALFSLVTG